MSSNLKLWDAVADIDPKFTKPITGRPYNGTSPNPHYLIKLATEHLGPVGTTWGWNVVSEGWQPLGSQTHHWCRVRVWRHEESSTGFEGYGQTKAAYTTNSGKEVVDEDAAKKSLTDALTKALAQMGFAANIFLGRWDDAKYVAEVNEEYRQQERADDQASQAKQITNANVALEACVTLAEMQAEWTKINSAFSGRVPQEIIDTKDTMKQRLQEEQAA